VFRYGLVINAVIYFVAVAAVVFFLIGKPINVLNERRRRGEEPVEEAELSDEVVLLTEIRDLLAARSGASGAAGAAGSPTDAPGEPPSTTGW
jgi:large conductance mechanosensitive channel